MNLFFKFWLFRCAISLYNHFGTIISVNDIIYLTKKENSNLKVPKCSNWIYNASERVMPNDGHSSSLDAKLQIQPCLDLLNSRLDLKIKKQFNFNHYQLDTIDWWRANRIWNVAEYCLNLYKERIGWDYKTQLQYYRTRWVPQNTRRVQTDKICQGDYTWLYWNVHKVSLS